MAGGSRAPAQALWAEAVTTFRKLDARLDLQAAMALFPAAIADSPAILPHPS
jgi:hypothetical protein